MHTHFNCKFEGNKHNFDLYACLPSQHLHFFASEHGKGICDGEAAVIKLCIRCFFATGTTILKNLQELISLLDEHLSKCKNETRNVHSVTERKFFAIPGIKNFICLSSYSCQRHFPIVIFLKIVAGTFPSRTMDTETLKGTQNWNNFLFTHSSPNSKAVFHRTISCTCNNCLTGSLGLCEHGFAPVYQQSTLRYTEVRSKITSAKIAASITGKLDKLTEHKDVLPFYFCLGWVERRQCPGVFLMTHLPHRSKNNDTVKCHVLPPYKVLVNDFHATTVVKPNQLCNKLAQNCDCILLHASIVPVEHILEIAVERGHNTPYKSCFTKAKVESPPPHGNVYHLPPNQANCNFLDNYCEKRFVLFDDYILLDRVEEHENML